MTDDFVKQAFSDADEAAYKREFEAYKARIINDEGDSAHITAAMRVGLNKMDKLCEVVLKAGQGDTLAEYAQSLLLVGFHIGYTSALEGAE